MPRRRLLWTCNSEFNITEISQKIIFTKLSFFFYRALKNATAKNNQAQHQLEEQRKKEEVSIYN